MVRKEGLEIQIIIPIFSNINVMPFSQSAKYLYLQSLVPFLFTPPLPSNPIYH